MTDVRLQCVVNAHEFRRKLTIGSHEQVQDGSCTLWTPSNVDIESEVCGMRSSGHPWAVLGKKTKHETKIEELRTNTENQLSGARTSSVSNVTKNFSQIFTLHYINFLLYLICFSTVGIQFSSLLSCLVRLF